MKPLEIDKALIDIVLQKYKECENKLNITDKRLKTERKAIQIELGMYGLCLRAGLLYHTIGTREQTLKHMNNQAINLFTPFAKIIEKFKLLSKDEQLEMVAALRQEAFMRAQFSDKSEVELKRARELNSIQDVFELEIKVKALDNVYKAWELWRVENNIYPNMFK